MVKMVINHYQIIVLLLVKIKLWEMLSIALLQLTTPVLDMLRPTRKQNVIGNMRPVGNARGRVGVDNPSVWNPADKLKNNY